MTVSGPTPPHPQRPADQPALERPLDRAARDRAAALLQASISRDVSSSLQDRVSFPFSSKLSRQVDNVRSQLQQTAQSAPRVPIWLAILTPGILPAVKRLQHKRELRALSSELAKLQQQQLTELLVSPSDANLWLALGNASADEKTRILNAYEGLTLEKKKSSIEALANAAKRLSESSLPPQAKRWGEQLKDRALRLEAALDTPPSDLEYALAAPITSSFARKVDAQSWLERTEHEPLSIKLPNRFILPGGPRSGIWAGDQIQLIDTTGRKERTVSISGTSEQLRADSAAVQIQALLPIKKYGQGPSLDESKASEPDIKYTQALEEKSTLLASLVNTDSRALVENLKVALQGASQGSLHQVGSTSTSQTMKLSPGQAVISVQGNFTLQADSGTAFDVKCSYTIKVDTTGPAEELRKRITQAEGMLEVEVKPATSQLRSPPPSSIGNDPRLDVDVDNLSSVEIPKTPIDWGVPLPGMDTLSLRDQNRRAHNLAYDVYAAGGPGTEKGKEALLQLCYESACFFHDPDNQTLLDQIVDPFDALRAVEPLAVKAGCPPLSLVEAYQTIQKELSSKTGKLIPWIFGPGASGSPLCDSLRETWHQDHPQPLAAQRR